MAGALDCGAEATLVSSASAGLAARLDLAALGQVAAKASDVFVVDLDHAVHAEGAHLAPGHVAVATPTRPSGCTTGARSAAEATAASATSTWARAAAEAAPATTAVPTGAARGAISSRAITTGGSARTTWSTARCGCRRLGSLLAPTCIRVVICLVCHSPS